jgi:hypothetical protein
LFDREAAEAVAEGRKAEALIVSPIADPHVCSPPVVYEAPDGLERWFGAKRT